MKHLKRLPPVVGKTVASVALLVGTSGIVQAQGAGQMTMPTWNLIYDGRGNIDDSQLDGAIALLIEDAISNGVAVDSSRLVRTVAVANNGRRVARTNRKLVDNGKIPTAHDLGNSYVVFGGKGDNEGKVYAATERMNRGQSIRTFVEFEFTAEPNRVKQGSPWPVEGKTSVNDLRARVLFVKDVAKWLEVRRVVKNTGGKLVWRLVSRARFTGSGCAEDAQGRAMACVKSIPGGGPVKTERKHIGKDGKTILVPRPNSMVELALDADALTQGRHKGVSMLVRTPVDIALLGLKTNEVE